MSEELSKISGDIRLVEIWVEECRKTLRDAEAKVIDLRRQRASVKYGIRAGVIVRVKSVRYRVEDLHPSDFAGKPWLLGQKIKQDGTPSKATVTIYADWEVEP